MAEGLGGSQKVGGIHVDVTANTAPLQAGLKQAETATQQTGQKMASNLNVPVGAAGIAGKGGFLDNFGNGIKGATAGLRSAVGAVTAVIGVFSRMLGVVGLVTSGVYLVNSAIGAMRGGTAAAADEAERMKQNLSDAQAVSERMKKELQAAQAALGEATTNPNAVDASAVNKAQQDVTQKATDVRRAEELIKSLEAAIKDADDAAEKRAIRARQASLKEGLVTQREDLKQLEAILENLLHGRDKAFKDIIDAATAKIIAIQREQTNKLLESIAIDSARMAQLQEQSFNAQQRGP